MNDDAAFEGASPEAGVAGVPLRESILKDPAGREAIAKDDAAFRTISELATDLGVPQHILRYWETRFPQLRPLQRAGNRRYYRPADVALARRIHTLLEEEHYTIKGVQRLLAGKSAEPEAGPVAPTPQNQHGGVPAESLKRVRTMLAEALAADSA